MAPTQELDGQSADGKSAKGQRDLASRLDGDREGQPSRTFRVLVISLFSCHVHLFYRSVKKNVACKNRRLKSEDLKLFLLASENEWVSFIDTWLFNKEEIHHLEEQVKCFMAKSDREKCHCSLKLNSIRIEKEGSGRIFRNRQRVLLKKVTEQQPYI